RLFATGCADGNIRVWDLAAATTPKHNTPVTNQFDLPPALDVPALDVPLYLLQGQRGPVEHLTFSQNGKSLAAVDQAGYLRVFSGFAPNRTSQGTNMAAPLLVVEARIDHPEQVSNLSAQTDSIIINRPDGLSEQFRFLADEFPAELRLEPDLVRVAWNEENTDLCIISLTDSYWLHASPLELFFHASGNNPVGVCCDHKQGRWFLPTEDHLDAFQLESQQGAWHVEKRASFDLVEAVKGQ